MPLGCVLLISKLYDEDLQIEFSTFTRGSKGSGGLSLCIFKYFHFQFSSNYSRLSVVFDPLRFSRTSSEISQFFHVPRIQHAEYYSRISMWLDFSSHSFIRTSLFLKYSTCTRTYTYLKHCLMYMHMYSFILHVHAYTGYMSVFMYIVCNEKSSQEKYFRSKQVWMGNYSATTVLISSKST